MKAPNPNRPQTEQLRANEQRFAAPVDASKPYSHILHQLIPARHMETMGHA